jgi:hypothetical protein
MAIITRGTIMPGSLNLSNITVNEIKDPNNNVIVSNGAMTSSFTMPSTIDNTTIGSGVTFPSGHIIQMTTNTMDSVFTITDNVNMVQILSCSITPKFNTSKIIISMTVHLWHTNYNTGKVCIFRDTTRIGIGTDTTNVFGGTQGEYGIGIRPGQYTTATAGSGRSWSANPYGLTYIDVPGTSGTSITYYLKATCGNDPAYPLYVNRGSDTADSPRPVSTITLLEVMS